MSPDSEHTPGPDPIRRVAYIGKETAAEIEARDRRRRRHKADHSFTARCPICFNEIDGLTGRQADRQSADWDKRVARSAAPETKAQRDELLVLVKDIAHETGVFPTWLRPYSADSYLPMPIKDRIRAAIANAEKVQR